MYLSRLSIEGRELMMVRVTFVKLRRILNALAPEIPADIPGLRERISITRKID
jgi:hypothetical protein